MQRGKMGARQQQLFWGGKVLPAVLLLFPEALHYCCGVCVIAAGLNGALRVCF